MKYYDMTNAELWNTYNASAEYDPKCAKKFVLVSECTKIIITPAVKTSTALWKKRQNS